MSRRISGDKQVIKVEFLYSLKTRRRFDSQAKCGSNFLKFYVNIACCGDMYVANSSKKVALITHTSPIFAIIVFKIKRCSFSVV